MSFGAGTSDTFAVKKFESQEEVAEKRRKRQEQWEKVRKPEDPEECPEEETRSLFEQLQDNKESKEREYEEEFKLRNSVKGLDEEETKFLDYVSNRQLQLERERTKEENVVLEELKEAAVKRALQEKASPTSPEHKKPAPVGASKKSQQSLLMGAIKRKSTDAAQKEESAKRIRSESTGDSSASSNAALSSEEKEDKLLRLIDTSKPVVQVAGILPGIGNYSDNSSSDASSAESDIEDFFPKKTIKIYLDVNYQ